MLDQISILFLSVILFAVMMKKRYSLKVLLISIVAGGMTAAGELRLDIFPLYAFMDGLITFMMWYSIITGIFLIIVFFSRDWRS